MSNLAIAIAAIPGAPIGVLVMNLAPALGPVGLALLVLVVLGAIVLLVGRDARHPAVAEGRRAEVACVIGRCIRSSRDRGARRNGPDGGQMDLLTERGTKSPPAEGRAPYLATVVRSRTARSRATPGGSVAAGVR